MSSHSRSHSMHSQTVVGDNEHEGPAASSVPNREELSNDYRNTSSSGVEKQIATKSGLKSAPWSTHPQTKPEIHQVERADFDLEKALADAHCEIHHKGENEGIYYIKSSVGDPENPRYWPKWKKYLIVGFASWLNNIVTIAVSDYSAGATLIQDEFGVSAEVVTVGLTTFIAGFATGPMLVAPLSEYYGRRPVYIVCFFLFFIFQLPVALAPNIGFFGSTPLANTGGVVHDLFGRDEGGLAVGIYALSSTDGPPFGNFVGGWVAGAKGWRWLFWFNMIVAGFFWLLIVVAMPETRDTIVREQGFPPETEGLAGSRSEIKKAKRLRKQTGNENIVALYERERSSAGHLYKVSLLRPFKFLFTEPITYWTALINGLTYGIIFLANQAFPLVFSPGNGGHYWTSLGLINSTYLAFVVGAIIGFSLQPLQEAYYRRAVKRNDGQSDPEARWFSSLFGIWLLPVGLFIAAWTSYADIIFIAPLIGFALFGTGFYMVIAAILNYVVDGGLAFSLIGGFIILLFRSLLGGVVFVRNVFGAVFPLFSDQMYKKLGNQKATTLIAGLSVGLVWIPFYFFYKGRQVRKASPYCNEHFEKEP